MTKTEIRQAALEELTPEEQLELAHELWLAAVPAPGWHRELVRERLAEHLKKPDAVRPWLEVKAKIFPELS